MHKHVKRKTNIVLISRQISIVKFETYKIITFKMHLNTFKLFKLHFY